MTWSKVSWVIREPDLSEAAALSELGRATFAGTFQHLYSAENLETFLSEFHSPEYYQRILNNPDQKIWVIEDRGRLLGYTLIGPNSLPCDPPLPRALELSRLYLREDCRGSGLGAELMERIIEYADAHTHPQIVLSVYAENFGGQRFYERYGFEKIGDYEFAVGDHRDPEFIFCKTL